MTPGKVSHQLAHPEIPGRAIVSVPHPIGEGAELIRFDFDDVADFMAESHARNVSIFGWCEHGAQKKDPAVRVLMMRSDQLFDQVAWIPADPG